MHLVRNNGPPIRVRLPPPRKATIRASELRWWDGQKRMQREWRDLEAAQAHYQQGEAELARLADTVFALLTSEEETEDAPGITGPHERDEV